MTERELFVEALGREDPAGRAAFLDAARPDEAARRRVEALLARHAAADPRVDPPRPADLLAALADTTWTRPAGPPAATAAEAAAELAALLGPSDRPGALGRVGHYDVLEVLGRGGFGIVARAFDASLHRVVAIKFLAPALAATSPPRQRFLREARAAARVTHDHVVRVHAVEEQPVPYLVMEYVGGGTLQDYLDATGPLPPAEVVAIGRQVALGLAAAHDQGLIHRDVKPANVLLDGGPERRARLTDFGLARAADDASLTQSGVLAGSPLYMAPEQARGEVLDARVDLFGLGSVLYTMTAGRPAFRAGNAVAVLKRVADDRPRPLPDVLPGTPPGLVAVIDRLLAKRPEERFATAREAADALAGCLTAPTPRLAGTVWHRGVALAAAAVLLAAGLAGLAARRNFPTPDAPATAAAPQVTRPPADPPPSWEDTVARLPADEQAAVVVARLKELNPALDVATVTHRVQSGVVIELVVNECTGLYDLTPVGALPRLEILALIGKRPAGSRPLDLSPLRGLKLRAFDAIGCGLTDLAPLAGMPLERCNLWGFDTPDLSPLRGMRLTYANVGSSPVSDISVLAGMPLKQLTLNYSRVDDLSPLRGLPLRMLNCKYTRVWDLTPLAGMPLQYLELTGSPVGDYSPVRTLPLNVIELDYNPARHAALLRSIRTLETINTTSALEVLGDDGR